MVARSIVDFIIIIITATLRRRSSALIRLTFLGEPKMDYVVCKYL